MFGIGKKRNLTHFEKEVTRINEMLEKQEIGSDEYERLLKEKKELYALEGQRKDLKRKLTPEAKGKILNTLISGLCFGGLAFGISRYELKGNLFTGENKTNVNAIVKMASRIFFG